MDNILIFLVLGVCASIQSIFGVGILVFGTPSLLLMGYSFTEVLVILLPCSVVVSSMQLIAGHSHIKKLAAVLPLITVPTISIGLLAISKGESVIDIRTVVSIMLLITALIRINQYARVTLKKVIDRHQKLFMAMTGFIHGFSNMGGALLTVMVGALFSDKESIRSNVAYGYLIFGITQLAVLFSIDRELIASINWIYPSYILFIYLIFNVLVFKRIDNRLYDSILTAVIGLYGVTLLFIS